CAAAASRICPACAITSFAARSTPPARLIASKAARSTAPSEIRRSNATKRSGSQAPDTADGKYNSKVLARFINKVMLRGKKSTAENLTYAALEIIAEKTGRDPMDIFSQALSNAMPLVEV